MSFQPLPTYDSNIPKWQLWDSTQENLIWTFYAVDDTNLPQAPQDTVTITNFRSSGAVVIEGGLKPFEAFLHFYLIGSGFTAVENQIKALMTAIPINVPFVLVPGVQVGESAPDVYNVKRIVDIEWLNVKTSLRNYYQECNIKFLANSW
jgi:hypothetical protein